MNTKNDTHFDSSIYLLNKNDFEPICNQQGTQIISKIKNKKNDNIFKATTLQKIYENEIDYIIHTLALFQHETIIKFYGYFKNDFSGYFNISIVTDWPQNGSLNDLFIDAQNENISNITMTKKQIILIGIARCMMILYKYNTIHGIVTPENVLLDKDFYPHINIFNNSTDIESEIKNDDEKLYEKEDVYSFGYIMINVILLGEKEMITQKQILSFQKLLANYQVEETENISESFKLLINRCLSPNPNERPTFEELFFMLAYEEKYVLENVDNNEVNNYIDLTKNDIFLCPACEKIVYKNDLIYFFGYSYHKSCIKCSVCDTIFDTKSANDDFVCISPSLFLCEQHYNDYLTYKFLSPTFFSYYYNKMMKNSDEKLLSFPIDKKDESLNDSSEISEHLELFSSSVTFHLDALPSKMDFSQLKVNLGKDINIIQVEKSFTFLKIAFIASNQIPKVEEEYRKLIMPIKELLNTSMGKAIVENFDSEPEITIPDDDKIDEFFNKKSINLLQNTRSLSSIDLKKIKNEVFSNLEQESMSYIFMQKEMFDIAEAQVRNDISYNPCEMIIIGQTIIANKFLNEYNKIKSKIPSEDVCERFVYHGSKLSNCPTIVSNNFYINGLNYENKHDDGFFGAGIYATDNIFYALGYSKRYFNLLKINEKASVILCLSIWNKEYTVDITKEFLIEQGCIEISDETKSNFGIHHVLVGSSTKYLPISEEDIDKNLVAAHEFVFPNTYQIIPICSFTVMRTDHYILWKDENIENNENAKYMKELQHKIKLNVYFTETIDDAIDLIETKKHNRLKLITNGGESLTGKQLIQNARAILRSNFVCLVFARNKSHLDWILQMENVLFTDDSDYFKKFAAMEMDKKTILEFAYELQNMYDVEFKINERSLLNFPLLNKIRMYS